MKKSWLILALLTFAGLAARFFLLRFEFVINPDGVAYTKLAQNLSAGNFSEFPDPYWSPLYPLLMAPVMFFTSDPELPGLLVSIICGSLLPVPVFLMVRQIYGEREGLAASALVAFYGHYLNLSITVTPSTLYYFLFALVLWFGWKALQENRLPYLVAAGTGLGLGYLTRPEAIGYVPIFAFFILSGFWIEKKPTLKKRGTAALILCFSFFLVALPYLIYLREATGQWTISAKIAPHLIGGNFSETSAFGVPQTPPQTLAESVKTVLTTLIYNFQKQHRIFSYLFPPLLLVFAAVGFFGEKWSPGRRQWEIYSGLLFLATFTAYVLTVVELVYMGTYLVILFVWAAQGITQLNRWLDENLPVFKWKNYLFGPRHRFFPVLCVIVVTVYSLPFLGPWRNEAQDREFLWREVKTSGLWLRENVSPNPKVLSSSPQIAFYARGEHSPLKAKTSDQIIARAKKEKVDFIAVSERTEKDLTEWLNGKPNSIEVKEIYRDETRPGCKLVIYQVIK